MLKKKDVRANHTSFSLAEGVETQRSSQVSEKPIQNIKKLKPGAKHEIYFPKPTIKKTTNFQNFASMKKSKKKPKTYNDFSDDESKEQSKVKD